MNDNNNKQKRICWITSSCFLDVDIPIVPRLKKIYDIDWIIVSTPRTLEDDKKYLESITDCNYDITSSESRWYSREADKFCQNLFKSVSSRNYDWYYLDYSSLLYGFQAAAKYLPIDKVTVAAHNVTTPNGARLYYLAKYNMGFVLRKFKHFQVFSLNQKKALEQRKPGADIFYCPLALKDYGVSQSSDKSSVRTFLYFGNILGYKRVDILLNAVNILVEKGITDFKVKIAGYCPANDWDNKYLPLVKHPEILNTDIRRIPSDEVAQLFESSDYFVMPYQSIAQSGAMTVALNYNLPIIASNLDTFREFITDNETGWFFETGNAVALAELMEKLIKMPDKEYERVRTNQSEFVKRNLSIESIVTRYSNYFDKCLN